MDKEQSVWDDIKSEIKHNYNLIPKGQKVGGIIGGIVLIIIF